MNDMSDFMTKAMRKISMAPNKLYPRGSDVFKPSIGDEYRDERINSWRLAVERSMKWTKIRTQEEKRVDYRRRSTLPIGLFLVTSFAILSLSNHFHSK